MPPSASCRNAATGLGRFAVSLFQQDSAAHPGEHVTGKVWTRRRKKRAAPGLKLNQPMALIEFEAEAGCAACMEGLEQLGRTEPIGYQAEAPSSAARRGLSVPDATATALGFNAGTQQCLIADHQGKKFSWHIPVLNVLSHDGDGVDVKHD